MSAKITVYTTAWCGYCIRLKQQLSRAGLDYEEINIEADPGAAELVQRLNGGFQTVPTVVLPDGAVLTNPSVRQIQEHSATAA